MDFSTDLFILIDKNIQAKTLVHGRNIQLLLTKNPEWIFVLDYNIFGTPQDIADYLYINNLDNNIFGIDKSNINKEWINYFNSFPLDLSYSNIICYSLDEINLLRNKIFIKLNTAENFDIVPNILEHLFQLYDEVFFANQITQLIAEKSIELTFCYNNKMTKTGGRCSKYQNKYKISISQQIILNTFKNNEKCHISNGLECYNRLECLMNIFEHELIHFIIQILHGHIKGDPIYKSHGKYFRKLVYAYFGHTETKHSLLHNLEKAGKREHFQIGDIVTYKIKDGTSINGIISKLNPKRAVIGNHCVPYTILKHSDINITNFVPTKFNTSDTNIKDVGKKFTVGDIISYEINGMIETSKILKVNSKTYNVGKYNISHSLAKIPTDF